MPPDGAVLDVELDVEVEVELVVDDVVGFGAVVVGPRLVVVLVVDTVVDVLELASEDEVVDVEEVVVEPPPAPVLTTHVTPSTLLKLPSAASMTMHR
jgi:hypothetical protein